MNLILALLLSIQAYAVTTSIRSSAGNELEVNNDGSLNVVASVGPPTPNTNGSTVNSTSITTTPTTFTAPADTVGFILMAESGNTANIRFAVGSAASTTAGMLMEAGRDSGYIPAGMDISVAAVSGTQSISIIWVRAQ